MDFQEFRQLDAWGQKEVFAGFTKEKQYEIFRGFESFHQPFVDTFYKDKLKCSIIRDGTIFGDGTLTTEKGKKIRVEEKYRTRDYQDFLIELIQDVTYPMTEKTMGWFYREKSDLMAYVICQAEQGKGTFSAEKPTKIYTINLMKLRSYLPTLLSAGANYTLSASKKGKGFTVNLAIGWDVLEMNNISRKYYL